MALQVQILGPTTVQSDEGILGPRDFGGIKPRQVLGVLALNAGRTITKDALIDCLWGEEPPAAATATLEAYVSILRKKLEPGVRASASVLRTTNGGYQLDPQQVAIDHHRFQQLLRGPGPQSRPRLAAALALADGDLLESEPYARWATTARESFNRSVVAACERDGARCLAQGEWAQAADVARRALGLDPLAEASARVLIEALWRDGRQVESLRAYDVLRRSLADELGADPDRRTQALYLEVLRSLPEGDVTAPAHPEVCAQEGLPIDTEVIRRSVGDLVRSFAGHRSSHQAFVDTLFREIAADLVTCSADRSLAAVRT